MLGQMVYNDRRKLFPTVYHKLILRYHLINSTSNAALIKELLLFWAFVIIPQQNDFPIWLS